MKDSHQDEKLLHQITPASKGRRCFIGSIATLGAGLTGSVILPGAVIAQLNPNAPARTKSTVSGCASRTVVASDAATVTETSAGKIRGFRRNVVYIFKQYCPEDDFLNSSNALQHKELGVILVFFDLKSRRPKTAWWKENRFGAKW